MIRPFTASITDEILKNLKQRIQNTRWPDHLIDSGWQYGADPGYMKELAKYWVEKYNWHDTENEINALPSFLFDTENYSIHFIHIRGKGKKSIPLIITHGWPGSFLEMIKIIPLLTTDTEFSFDVVIPSIPGYGFSSKPTQPGCNFWQIGELWHQLMTDLGYEKYMVQGGDMGAGIGTALGLKHPESVLGLHLNYIPGSYSPYLSEEDKLSEEEREFLSSAQEWFRKEGSYGHQHRTKPLTLAYGLNDSPVGLCAWIVEKFMTWSDCNGKIESIFTKDELLSNITLYWVTETIHSSIRLYYENSKVPLQFSKNDFVHVPVGIARFQKEEPFPPRKYIERGYNVQHWSDFDKGGHFAAMEQPEKLADDIRAFANKII
jgi:pimeloyl-ACP methyl ester carboxylesterase